MKRRDYLSDIEDRSGNGFSVIADFDGNEEQLMDIEVDEVLPVLPLRNMVLFPGVFMPVSVGRKSSLRLVRDAEKKNHTLQWCVRKWPKQKIRSLKTYIPSEQ